ncbi:MAG: PilC/PilY family type IV pilus protein [Marinobacter sp.]|nr:PilC/PilY family type IV pilus protein [Marinobacter sp.]
MPQRFNGMSGRIRKFGHLLFPFLLLLPLTGYAQPGELSQSPLFLNDPVKHNLMIVGDDSWHMDLELFLEGTDYGRLDNDTLTTWMGNLLDGTGNSIIQGIADSLIGDVQYGYLFEVGLAGSDAKGIREYDGQRLNETYQVVPPIKAYGFMRSHEYNSQYYDPSVDYEPWEGLAYSDATLGDPLLDPNYAITYDEAAQTAAQTLTGSLTEVILDTWCGLWDVDFLGLLGDPPGYCEDSDYPLSELRILPFAFSGGISTALESATTALDSVGTVLDEVSELDNSLTEVTFDSLGCSSDSLLANMGDFLEDGVQDVFYQCVAHRAATYFVPVDEGTYDLFDASNDISLLDGGTGDCANPNPEHYATLVQQWSTTNLLDFRRPDGNTEFDGALAPDGRCLERVEVEPDRTTYPSGRSFEEELQNFSNWFQYHRRRHQSVRYSMGQAAHNLNGMYADYVTVNDAASNTLPNDGVSDAVMKDTTDRTAAGEFDSLLEEIYHGYDDTPASNESPMRAALADIGDQLQRTDGSAPIQYECQKNYALLYTDGFTSDLDYTWTGTSDNAAPEPFGDTYSSTLADVAYGLRTTNLRSDLPAGQVNIPTTCSDDSVTGMDRLKLGCDDVNPHLNTLAVLMGGNGSVYGEAYSSVDDAFATPPTWPDVNDGTASTTLQYDDLYHATVDGLGEIFSSYLPDTIASYINASLQDASVQQGSAAAVAFNSASVSADSLMFSASFNASNWSGRLIARQLNSSNGRLVAGDDGSFLKTFDWEAGEVLTNDMTVSDRNLVTWNGSTGVDFTWDNLTTSQQNDLKAGGTVAEGQERLAYHQGVRTLEGSKYRTRASLLGDIVYSAPVLVSRPRMGWPDVAPFGGIGERYSHFRADNVDRAPTVYVGANDGMLHAFEATLDINTGGQERFAYIPGLVFDEATDAGLSYLTEPGYEHRYYVDLSPAISDAYIDSGDGDAWHTVLIGGLRAGGKGLFALNITNPEILQGINASDMAMWEFTDDRLGYTTEPVNIALVPWGNNNYEWVAIFGNGYNATTETTGLFMLKLEGGLDGTWTEDADYRYIELAGAGSHGLTSDVRLVDLDGDRVIDRIYAGDLDGKLWVLDTDNQDEWQSAYKSGSDPAPLFTAASGQAITAPPMVVRNTHVEDGTAPNLLVLFGTGQYLTSADLVDTSLQSFYGVWDENSSSLVKTDLLERDITETSTEFCLVRNLSDDELVWGSGNEEYMGWYIDFDTKVGERVIQTPQVRNKTIIFNTTIPAEDDPCGSAGSSFRMFVDLDGTDPDHAVFDLNGDRVVNNDDTIISGFYHSQGILTLSAFLGNVMFDNMAGNNPALGQETNENVVDFGASSLRGRLSWRELIDR